MNWRKLTIEPHKLPRRCHDRNIYGPLQPMDEPDRWQYAVYWIVMIPTLGYLVSLWIGG